MKISVILRGGLGNQLFQASAGQYFARKHGVKAFLEDSVILRHQDPSRRSWIRNFDLDGLFGTNNLRMRNRLYCEIKSRVRFIESSEKPFTQLELENLDEMKRSIRVYDWFHSKKFLPAEKIQLNENLLRNLNARTKDISQHIATSPKIGAIHIRLGDFKATSWGVLPQAWYLNALRQLHELGVEYLDCYSDDIQEAKLLVEPISSLFHIRFPELESKLNPHELLWILANYKFYVSSNSSLSWWASYFNIHNEPRILSPWRKELHLTSWRALA